MNGQKVTEPPGRKYKYYVTTTGKPIPDELLDSLRIVKSEVTYNPVNSLHVIYLTEEKMRSLKSYAQVRSIQRYSEPILSFQNQEIFPHHPGYHWTGDNFGPLVVPARGDSIRLDHSTLPLYQRIIQVYENNEMKQVEGQIYINGDPVSYYTFKMDYYFVLGDNHHNSADSRYWGFVPEDHLLGKAMTIWFSIEPEKPVMEGLRKERIFKTIN